MSIILLMRWVEIVILHEYDYVNQVNKRAYSYVELADVLYR